MLGRKVTMLAQSWSPVCTSSVTRFVSMMSHGRHGFSFKMRCSFGTTTTTTTSSRSSSLEEQFQSLQTKPFVRRGNLDRMIEQMSDSVELPLIQNVFRYYESKFVDPNEETMIRFAQAFVRTGQPEAFWPTMQQMKQDGYRAAMYSNSKACLTIIMNEFLRTGKNQEILELHAKMGEINPELSMEGKPIYFVIRALLNLTRTEDALNTIQTQGQLIRNRKLRATICHHLLWHGLSQEQTTDRVAYKTKVLDLVHSMGWENAMQTRLNTAMLEKFVADAPTAASETAKASEDADIDK